MLVDLSVVRVLARIFASLISLLGGPLEFIDQRFKLTIGRVDARIVAKMGRIVRIL